jgi:outer membrane protein OmpA-like peptidoglycan-associated protein
MAGEHVVYGKFKGRYKTNQVMPLTANDAYPTDIAHKVQIYQGNLDTISFDNEYRPEKHRVFKSFVLSNVENIEVAGTPNGPFSKSQLYDFTQFILIDPKIESAHNINGATYGDISGMVYGKTQSRPKISKLDPPDPPPTTAGNGDGNNGGNTYGPGATGDTGFNDNSEIGDYLEKTKAGCANAASGCFQNFWRFLKYLILLLLLWLLIKACAGWADRDDCSKRRHNKILLERLEKERDSLRIIYDQNLQKALANIDKIYFYRGTSEIHQYSRGADGNVERLKHLLSVYNDKKFIIVGHRGAFESAGLDSLRAKTVRKEFVRAGIAKERIEIRTKADKEPLESEEVYPYMFPNYNLRYYNRNMRVEIRIKK